MRELTELDRIHLVLALQRHTSKQQLAQQASERAPAWGDGLWDGLHGHAPLAAQARGRALIAAIVYING